MTLDNLAFTQENLNTIAQRLNGLTRGEVYGTLSLKTGLRHFSFDRRYDPSNYECIAKVILVVTGLAAGLSLGLGIGFGLNAMTELALGLALSSVVITAIGYVCYKVNHSNQQRFLEYRGTTIEGPEIAQRITRALEPIKMQYRYSQLYPRSYSCPEEHVILITTYYGAEGLQRDIQNEGEHQEENPNRDGCTTN